MPASSQVVDYLLLAGSARIVVEAKVLTSDLSSKDGGQLVGYCAQEGIRWALLSNGTDWQVFDTEFSGNWERKRVASLDLDQAQRAGTLATEIESLALLSFDSMTMGGSGIEQWAESTRVVPTADDLLRDPKPETAQTPVGELVHEGPSSFPDRTGYVVQRREVTDSDRTEEPDTSEMATVKADSVAFYLFPVRGVSGLKAAEHLREWLTRSHWGVRSRAGYRRRVRKGDYCCFYATGQGVVARARIDGDADQLVPANEWPSLIEYRPDVYNIPLIDVEWLDERIPIDRPLRESLDGFRGKDPVRKWGWFVQNTTSLSRMDFERLTDAER